jgi:toxin CcdB
MAQFDVYANSNPETNRDIPYLVDVQSDLLAPLSTRVVIPLVKEAAMPKPAQHLNPVFNIHGEQVVLSTAELAGVPKSAVGGTVGSLSSRRDEIIRAIDFLLAGI